MIATPTARGVRARAVPLLAAAAACCAAACTDSNLYSLDRPPVEADRVSVSGRVCTDDPVESQYPVKVVLLVDQAAGPLFASYDPQGERIKTLNAFIQSVTTAPATEVAVVRYAGRSGKLAPLEGDFTRNPGVLQAAVQSLALPEPCIGLDKCRDYHSGLRTARALIEGDLASLDAGTRILTQYVIVHVNAGPHVPTALGRDCCPPDDQQCIQGGGGPSLACQAQQDSALIADLRATVATSGGAGLKYHAFHLAAEEDPDVNAGVQQSMSQMAFAGGGRYQRFEAIGGFSPEQLDVLDLRTVLRVKHLVVANVNAKATPKGPAADSDGDGMSDDEEAAAGTSPGNRDTDGDDINDFVETLLGFDPLLANVCDVTDVDCPGDIRPKACDPTRVGRDADRDGLTDCEEALLGTDPSLVDSDGDGLPDRLELEAATDYLHRDAETDSDGDGISNGDEVRNHTDPRSTDAGAHLSFAYRYSIDDEGIVTTLVADEPEQVTGVKIVAMSGGTTAGVGTLRFAAETRALSWQDAQDKTPGPLVFVGDGGDIELPSSSFAPIQGDEGRFVTVRIDVAALPPRDIAETLKIVYRQQHCVSYTVRNVRLMATKVLEATGERGLNEVILYFAQAPEDRIDIPGPFRMAQVPIIFVPPAARQPGAAVIRVFDEEFVRSNAAL